MRIKVKLFLENTTGKEELAKYLIDCLAQKAVGHNLEVTTNEDAADIHVDLKECMSKEDVLYNLNPIVLEITRCIFDNMPKMQPGQKKVRKKLRK